MPGAERGVTVRQVLCESGRCTFLVLVSQDPTEAEAHFCPTAANPCRRRVTTPRAFSDWRGRGRRSPATAKLVWTTVPPTVTATLQWIDRGGLREPCRGLEGPEPLQEVVPRPWPSGRQPCGIRWRSCAAADPRDYQVPQARVEPGAEHVVGRRRHTSWVRRGKL